MVAKEAGTSLEVKKLLVATPGVSLAEEKKWEQSYEKQAGTLIYNQKRY
jgi:enoyl reductase-like protein